MKIGLNLLYLRPGIVGGTETYAAGLLGGLAELGANVTAFVNTSARDWPMPEGVTRVVCPVGPAQGPRYLYEQTRLPLLVWRHKIDVLHSLGYVAPLVAPCPSVVTVHDLNFRSGVHQMPAVRRAVLNGFVTTAVRRCNAVIAVSAFSRREISDALPGTSHKIHVVHEAARRRVSVPGPSPMQGPYLVAFSSSAPHKNLRRLVEAHARARQKHAIPHRLVMIGHRPAWATEGEVHWTGYLPDDEADRVLAGATALVFPSLYEGFGLPLMEAMQAGVPIACSTRGSLPEVAQEAAIYFDPEDVPAITHAIWRLAADPPLRARLIATGAARRQKFTWTRTAEETVAVYDHVLWRNDVSAV